jgi:hypothetical protein
LGVEEQKKNDKQDNTMIEDDEDVFSEQSLVLGL